MSNLTFVVEPQVMLLKWHAISWWVSSAQKLTIQEDSAEPADDCRLFQCAQSNSQTPLVKVMTLNENNHGKVKLVAEAMGY